MPLSSEEVAREWFDGLWNRGDAATIDRLLAEDAVVHGLPSATGEPIRGRAEFRPFFQAFRSAFPDIWVALERVVADGEFATCYCRVTGTQKGDLPGLDATGRRVDFCGFAMVRVVDGQAREAWNCFDFLAMYTQLGVDLALPPKTRTA
jgi:steroid delta-isomerase-like uncharacterized protein